MTGCDNASNRKPNIPEKVNPETRRKK